MRPMAAVRKFEPVATVPDAESFRLLALCTQRPGEPRVAAPLSAALSRVAEGVGLVDWSDHHALGPLLLAHMRELRAAVPSIVWRAMKPVPQLSCSWKGS